ncbi:MerR family transcriptional regulator [Cypionkella psychrotolerans]|uniref:MerR family transcriptional regulator n=1 Tax=Cypionkella psychrotolerans TaxID=1678131 RepID=UPI0009E8544F|nr:MerR family DNA-binding transcriptional regulator [Cypionkella psychrotolerans]
MSLSETETLSIRQMCDAYQVTARTLRFYEAKELLSPIRAGSRRLYTKQDRARLQLILRGKRFGFSLEDIRQLLDMYNRNGSNQAQLARSFDLGQDRLAQMKAQRDELSIAITELEVELQGAGAALASLRAAAE